MKYDKLRGDYYRQSKRLEYYESGQAYEALIKKHEKETRSLQYALKRSEEKFRKLCEKNEKNKAEIDRLRRIISEKDDEADRLIKEYDEQLKEYKRLIDEMRKQIEDMNGQMRKMSAQLNRDYTNSSKPSSKNENYKKIANSRVRTGRKAGGQKGHTPHRRRPMVPTEPVIQLIPEEVLKKPEEWEEMEDSRVRQVVDAKMTVTCVQYEAKAYRNKKTGQIIYSAFPANVVNEVNYGEGIKALCCLMTSYCNVSIRKTSELIQNLTDGRLNISVGMIAGLPKELKSKTESERIDLIHKLMKSPSLHNDATHIRINGERWNIYVTSDGENVIYTLSRSKGIEGIKTTPLKNYLNVVIHDHDKSYYSGEFGFSGHQECLSHIIRYCQDSIDNEPELTRNKRMKSHIQWIIHRYKTGELEEDELNELVRNYDEILETAEQEYLKTPPTKYYREGFNLARRLKEYRNETLAFLFSETELEYENNLSERLLRACKRKSHAVVSFRSADSVSSYCDIMSIIKTADAQGSNIYEILKKGFAGSKSQ